MGKLVVAVIVVAVLGYAWHAGWMGRWFDAAVDSSIDSVRGTQQARKVRTDEKR